ncbi:hypothetical protein [Puniceibacterium confluentis]|uniref:hypothetical protein n=1 Tax=Puniceibacterium confluentis TaxID=1958944 RepID=UPI0011B7C538|nr:hypothetical protein [Puniceibacterium confluentis]
MTCRIRPHTRGATFRMRDVLPMDLTGYTIRSQAVAGNFVTDLECRVVDEAGGVIEVEQSAALTAAWPLGMMSMDVRAQLGDEVAFSEILTIHVLKGVTQ